MRAIALVICLLASSCSATRPDPLASWEDLDEFERVWYSKHLNAAREKSIVAPTDGVVVRLTWLRSFHSPIVVRINCAARCTITGKRLNGAGGYEPGRIVERRVDRLTDSEAQELYRLVALANLSDPMPESEILMMDGAMWVIEVANRDGYFAWSVQGTRESQYAKFHLLGDYLVELSRIEVADEDYY